MNKIHVVVMGLFAVLAFSSLAASSAFALTFELAEWLVAGTKVEAELPSEVTGEILFEDNKFAAIVCDGILDGTIGPNSQGRITKILNLAGEEIGELTGSGLLCATEKTCESSTTDIEVFPMKLPWDTEVELDIETKVAYVLVLGAERTYECLLLGILGEDACTVGETETEVDNVTGGVELKGHSEPLGNCSIGGPGSGLVEFITGKNLLASKEGTVEINK
jgi:hypothetical protein